MNEDLVPLLPDARTEPARLALDYITLDHRLQLRALKPNVVKDYVGVLRCGELPPVLVVRTAADEYLLVDGHHRYAAHQILGLETIGVQIVDGTFDDALWLSWAANRDHGLRRTRKEKRHAILAAVQHPRWSKESDREIAQHIGCDHKTVGAYRHQCPGGEFPTQRIGVESRSGPSKKEFLQACGVIAKVQPEQARTLSSADLALVRSGYERLHRILFGESTLSRERRVQDIVEKAA